jgi:hypothetical protein
MDCAYTTFLGSVIPDCIAEAPAGGVELHFKCLITLRIGYVSDPWFPNIAENSSHQFACH